LTFSHPAISSFLGHFALSFAADFAGQAGCCGNAFSSRSPAVEEIGTDPAYHDDHIIRRA